MARNREDRYETITKMARDVHCWLKDEPVSVWQEHRILCVRRWGRRHGTFVASGLGILLVGPYVY